MSKATVAVTSGVIRSDSAGFSRLGRLAADLANYENTIIDIDLGRVAWLDAHLAAPLLIVLRHAQARGNRFRFVNAQPDVALTLKKNRFFARPADDVHKTTMPISEFELTGGVDFSKYAKAHLNRKEVPEMSPALRSKFYEGIDELFANSALHSRSMLKVAVCGQLYPRNGRLDFSIADGGRTISGCLRDSRIGEMEDHHAISWAMEPLNTTRQGDIPGGLGSKILREFIQLNGGKLIVASRSGFWCQKGHKVVSALMPNIFPGTAVVLEINTSDRNKYDLVNAPSANNIW